MHYHMKAFTIYDKTDLFTKFLVHIWSMIIMRRVRFTCAAIYKKQGSTDKTRWYTDVAAHFSHMDAIYQKYEL